MTHSPAPSLPTPLRNELPNLNVVGQTALRYFGLLVYDIHLWSHQRIDADHYAQQVFALDLTYARKLEGAAIAERSLAEMRRIGPFDDAQARHWLSTMKQAFPDVAANEHLIGLNDGQGGVRFFHQDRQTAELSDPTFAQLFFGIWLSPQTSAPAMRAALLGA